MPGISDHDLVLLKTNIARPITRQATKQFYDFNNAEDDSISDFLEQEYDNFSARDSDGHASTNELWLDFKSTVHKCIHRYVPLRKKKIHSHSPWITREIIHLKRRVKRLSHSISSVSRSTLASLRRDLRNKIKQSKFQFINVKLHNFLINDPRKFWIHLTQKKDPINKLTINDVDVTDCQQIAATFNDYFSSVFLRGDGRSTDFRSISFPVPDLTISEQGIFSALLHLNTKKNHLDRTIFQTRFFPGTRNGVRNSSLSFTVPVCVKATSPVIGNWQRLFLCTNLVLSSTLLTTGQFVCCVLQVK